MSQATLNTREQRRILASSFIGTMVEYYDFMLYATCASIVFNKVFFNNLTPGLALFASFASLAVGHFLRPVGGLFFGHFGDRLGRKKMLVITMVLMGLVTLAIGLLPTQAQIGLAAPVILILLRMLQGFAVGGEWGGAVLMALEHAPKKDRGFAASFANAGGPAGAISATLVLSLVTVLTGDQFLAWGWRIPFMLSAVLVFVGMVVRLKVSESPVFQTLMVEGERRRMPVVEVFSKHLPLVLLTLTAALSFYVTQGIVTVWGVSVVVGAGESQSAVLNWKAVGAVVTLIVTFGSAKLSDIIGRRRMLLIAGGVAVAAALPLTMLIGQGTVLGFALGVVLGNGVVQGLLYGPLAAYISEQFPASVRYTGCSAAYQTASSIGAGLTPMIAAGLMLVQPGGLWLVGAFWAAMCALSAAVVLFYQGRPADEPSLEAPAAAHGVHSTGRPLGEQEVLA